MKSLIDLDTSSIVNALFYGDAGTGKTIAGTSFPTPLFVADFDNKISSAANHWKRHSIEQLKGISYDSFIDPDPVRRFSMFYTWLVDAEKLVKEGKPLPWKTIMVDSITFFSEALMSIILKQNPGIKGPIPGVTDMPSQQHYGIFGVRFKEIIGRTLALPCNVVYTGHLENDKDENTGLVKLQPSVKGKNAVWLPAAFKEVYRQYADVKDGKVKYLWQTQADRYCACRTEIPVPNGSEAGWSTIAKALGINQA